MEYFIDQEKHFCLILLYTYTTLCIGVTALVAIGSMLIAYLQHICGMLSISRYRINRALRFNMLKNEKFIFKEIFHAVDIHRQAMRLSELLVSNFEIMLFFLIIFGVISMSLNLLQIFQIRTFYDYIDEFLLRIAIVIAIIAYMFTANYVGQDIMDHNNHIFVTVYAVQWYVAPL
ncbi:PREDICTED: uncharacterized protein LOC105451625, partial [Wasmannia auropunctata]|uniref:uncharacterized protein LOC105451625 n=1 Tax=Wasmannia auropunctata TaxID=64793 RepID=UPI0005EF6BFB